MKQINLSAKTGHSTILVGESIDNISLYLPDSHIVIITDKTVLKYYGNRFPNGDLIEIGEGETIKTLSTMQDIYDQMIQFETDRSSFVLGIGGGIVCDITGFAASTYMRGLDFGFVATTLLAQVDASIGGKNGVNVQGFKNMVGVFQQPHFAICDPLVLKTLSDTDYRCGLAEIVKHAIIADEQLFQFIENNIPAINNRDANVLERLIYDSVIIKSDIVNQDETETGKRKKLNFGHTFGHAIEKITQLPHGQAVSIGMVMASEFAYDRGMLDISDLQRITDLLYRLNLPVSLDFSNKNIVDAMKKDKKRKSDVIYTVLPQAIGHVNVVECPISVLYQMNFRGGKH
jgi:3-dehydroquinate synthase